MNRQEHLLCILAEECNEVAQRVSKALRFGLNEVQEGQNATNSQRLILELGDLLGTLELLSEEEVLCCTDVEENYIELRKEKIRKYLDYSKQIGTLV